MAPHPDSGKTSRKIDSYSLLGLLACLAWAGIVAFLYLNRLELSFLLRFLMMIPLAVLGGGACFLLLWRPVDAGPEVGAAHEDFGSALRVQKIAAQYVTIPILNRSARKEIIPAAITAGVLFLVGITPLGPFKSEVIKYPDPSMLIAREILRPTLFLAGDSLAVLAPPALSPQTESREKIFLENSHAMKIVRRMLQGKFQEAVDFGNVTESSDPAFLLAFAQAQLLNGDYENAWKRFQELHEKSPTVPVITLQAAVAGMYAGDLEKAKNLLNSVTTLPSHEDFPQPEMILEHLRVVHSSLSGKDLKKAEEKMKRLWDAQWRAYVKSFQAGGAEEVFENAKDGKRGGESGKKAENSLKSAAEAVRGVKNQARKLTELQERLTTQTGTDFTVLNQNHAVLLVLLGQVNGAYRQTEWTKSLADDFSGGSRRLSRVLSASAWNTQGVILTCFEKYDEKTEDSGGKKAEAGEIPPGVAEAEGILADAPLPAECFRKASSFLEEMGEKADAPSRLILQSNLLTAYVRCEFSRKSLPTLEAFLKVAEAPLQVIRDMSQKQSERLESGVPVESVPMWMVATQNTLMEYYAQVEGRDNNVNQNFERAVQLTGKKLGPDSLSEIAAATRYAEMRLAARFAKDSAIKPVTDTEKLLKKYVPAAQKELPAGHPLLARLLVCSARMALMKDRLKVADTRLKEALEAYKMVELPGNYSGKLTADSTAFVVKFSAGYMAEEPNPAETLSAEPETDETVSAKKLDTAEMQTEMRKLKARFTAVFGGNSLATAQFYRDAGYVFVVRNLPAKAAEEYQRAMDVYTFIFGEKATHPFISAMKTMIGKMEGMTEKKGTAVKGGKK